MNKITVSIKNGKDGNCEVTLKPDFKDNEPKNVKTVSINIKNAISNALKELSKIEK